MSIGPPNMVHEFDFKKRFTALKAELEEQMKEEASLNEIIKDNLLKIRIDA